MRKSHISAIFIILLMSFGALAQKSRPNVVIIIADDLGWGDVGFNGCTDIPTPNLDNLAKAGITFTAGYASHSYCSPSRAGIMTGRYQQRFGHECNPGYPEYEDEVADGLPLSETLMSNIFKDAGYTTAAIGKWHLGDAEKFWPIHRGFDYWYGFSGGGMNYWGVPNKSRGPISGVLENGKVVPQDQITYLTDDFSKAAVSFIHQNKEKPFFLYLAYNAPHAPDQATKEYLEATNYIEYGGRSVYAAMVHGMDVGIGKVLAALQEDQLSENTVVIFMSDNGGRGEHANNFPYRGHKGMLFEGGIRVPFCMAWPAQIKAGQTYDAPVTGLDILPTAASAAHINYTDKINVDGANLLPFLTGNKVMEKRPLFWRYSGGEGWVSRLGNYKLVHTRYKKATLLFDLDKDPYEHHDIADQHPELVQQLTEAYKNWDAQLMQPLWMDPHIEHVDQEEKNWEEIRRKASAGQRH